MSARACALRIEIDLSQQGAGSDFEVSQALRQLADQIASRRFTGLVEDAQGDLLLAQHGGTYRLAGHWGRGEGRGVRARARVRARLIRTAA